MRIKYFIEENRMTAPKELRGVEIIIRIRKEGKEKCVATVEVPKKRAGLKSTNKPQIHFVKNCPECGGEMIKTNPNKSKWGQILGYKRITCQSCGHYEAYQQRSPSNVFKGGMTADEVEKMENEKANKYYSPTYEHRKKMGL